MLAAAAAASQRLPEANELALGQPLTVRTPATSSPSLGEGPDQLSPGRTLHVQGVLLDTRL